jgi:hypothetical protein
LKPLIEQRDDSDLMDDDLEELSPNGPHSESRANIEQFGGLGSAGDLGGSLSSSGDRGGQVSDEDDDLVSDEGDDLAPDETNMSPLSSSRVALSGGWQPLSSGGSRNPVSDRLGRLGSSGDLGGSLVSPSDEILDNGMQQDEEEDLAPSQSNDEMIPPVSPLQADRLTAFSSMPNLYAGTRKLSKRYQNDVNRASDHVAKTKTAASMLLQHSQSYENSIGTLDKNLKAFNAGVQKFRQSTASKHADRTKHLGEALSQGLQDGIGAWPSQ